MKEQAHYPFPNLSKKNCNERASSLLIYQYLQKKFVKKYIKIHHPVYLSKKVNLLKYTGSTLHIPTLHSYLKTQVQHFITFQIT